ncbi:uncharacterized protein PV09_09629 [Verruconis gallopava]|uniref:Uncharacterized protein n=1 Tax=Verruconis gallopava TaxID=253628 RepID=A0A0D1ZVV6_9PEZI|nr:uncharacterized protein PV09_09629 [Verruconis gallopava]KIV98582.1 hypothetical protein PV09_09629 [Verruconis gallopava]
MGLFNDGSKTTSTALAASATSAAVTATATCPSDAFFDTATEPVVGDHSFDDLAKIIAGACTIFTTVVCFGLCFLHLVNYRVRSEQRQIARIVLTPAIISIFEFFGIWKPDASGFLKPIGEYYDALALVSLYLLFQTLATPSESRGSPNVLFNNLPDLYAAHAFNNAKGNQLSSYYRTWWAVFQIVPVRAVMVIATMAVYGTICDQLKDSNRLYTIISAITTISTVICFLAVIRLMKYINPSLKGHSPVMKTVSLKGLVAFSVALQLVMSILKSANAIHPSSKMSKIDWFITFPSLLTCGVSVIFAVLIVSPYWISPYTAKSLPGAQKTGFFRAAVDLVNFTDILFVGLARLPSAVANWKRKGALDEQATYRKAPGSESGPVLPPPVYSSYGRQENNYEMNEQPRRY